MFIHTRAICAVLLCFSLAGEARPVVADPVPAASLDAPPAEARVPGRARVISEPTPTVVRNGPPEAPGSLASLVAAKAQSRAALETQRINAVQQAFAFEHGTPAYRRAHTIRYVRLGAAAANVRRATSLPQGSNACIEISDDGFKGGPHWLCYFNDVGATVSLSAASNLAASTPLYGQPGYYCNGPTYFINNNTNPSMQVTESPTSSGGGIGTCNRVDGPSTTALTRVGGVQNDQWLVQVQAEVLPCGTAFGDPCSGGDVFWPNMYVNVYYKPAPTPSAVLPERACGRCNGTSIGRPIDVATGELWNEQTDLALSGPFGLSFTRFYGNQTAGSADLGSAHWLHTYSSRLDVAGLTSGNVTYYDFEGMPYYFSSISRGSSSYDNLTGQTLALSTDGATYTLTSFSNMSRTFNAKGELTQQRDRLLNTQTISRDATPGHNDRILNVTDVLGRQLCFYYDGANRIQSVAGWINIAACPGAAPPSSNSTPVVSMTYDTGTNCVAGDLCAVTEPDGNVWTYQYAISDPAYPGNLTKVIDPLGDVEESNSYSGNVAIHQESGNCASSPCSETGNYITITYPTDGSGNVRIVDGLGRQSTLQFDAFTLLIKAVSGPICKCGGDQTRFWTYDSNQHLVAESDDGVDGSFKHSIMYSYGRDTYRTSYPGPTSITEILDPQGTKRTTTLTYYALGDPRQDVVQTKTQDSVDSPGHSLTTVDTYSTTGLLTQRATTGFVNGLSTTYTRSWSYDSRGRLLTETGPRTDLSLVTRYGYFSDTDADTARAGQLATVTDALGHLRTLSGGVGFTSYTPFGDPQSLTDPNGVTNDYVYDARGRLLSSSMLPAAEGDQTLLTQTVYDAAGRRIKRILPALNSVSFGYDTSSRLIQVTRADTALSMHDRLLLTYNAFDQMSTAAAQNCTAPSPACGGWSTTWSAGYAYSASTSDLISITNADSTVKRFGYTAQGGLASFNDENHPTGNDYTNSYDVAGRRLSETRILAGAAGGTVTTRYTYDLHDNAIGVTDPNGNITTYHYDDFDRLTKETSPVAGVTSYAYDPDGNLMSTTNANGATATFTYDALDRMLTESDTKGSAAASEVWTYDDPTPGNFGIGRLATMTDPSGSSAFTYDRRGYVQAESHNVAGATFTYGYGYDVNGNRSTVTFPDNTIVSYTFDFADRPYSAQQVQADVQNLSVARHTLSRIRAKSLPAPYHPAKSELPRRASGLVRSIDLLPPGRAPAAPTATKPMPSTPTATAPIRGVPSVSRSAAVVGASGRRQSSARPNSMLVASATYAPFGPMTSMAFGNGTTQTISYNQRYLPQENKLVASGTTLADHLYSEDSVGNITAISDALDAGYARNFGYDDLNRMTTANSGSKLWGTASGNGYTYDPTGNMLTLRLGAARTDTFTYRGGSSGSTGLPLLSSVVENGSTRNVSYDAIGSELGDGVNSFAYGARELLGSALPNMQTLSYDGFKRRVQTQTATGQQRTSLYDAEDRLLSESVLSTATPTSIAYDYVWFGDRPVAQLDGTGTHWTYADHLGTPMLQTDSTAAVSWQAEHEPYGKVWSLRSGDVHQPLRLPGQVSDQLDTGANGLTELSYNGARWYRPGWGRYTQIDPIRQASTSPFTYGNMSPAQLVDRDGQFPKRLYGDPYCVALRETIQNIFDSINTRIGELNEDHRNLPERAAGDRAKPSTSRWGHRRLINIDKANLAQRRAEYDANCDDPSGPLSCPATMPSRARNTVPSGVTTLRQLHPEPADRFSPSWWWWWIIVAPKPPVPVAI